MICYTYQQVYEYYATIARFLQNRGLKILKTDTHNESGVWPISIPLAPILDIGNELTCVELDEVILDCAKKNFPQLRLLPGDVRNLDQSVHYDLLLDFSTIDHVMSQEFPDVLRQYNKIANTISIIVWLSDTRPSRDNQYFFRNFDFRNTFHNIFGEYNEIMLFSDKGASLVHFINKRPNSNTVMDFINSVDFTTLSEMNEDRARTETEIETLRSITNSRSWKLTASFRSAARLARKVRKVYTAKSGGIRYHWEYIKKLND